MDIADGADYVSIFRFFSSIADFGSDILLSIVFFIMQDVKGDDYFVYFILCLSFTIVPYLASCCVGLYFIETWRNAMDGYMLKYLKRYDGFLLFITIIGGFFSSVELAKSRLFYLPIFNLHLPKIDDIRLKNARFFTTVVLENIPQVEYSD